MNPIAQVVAAIVFCGAGVVLLARERKRLAGTTLIGAWGWAVASLAAVAVAELLAGVWMHAPDVRTALVRYVAATCTFAPGVYVLGARRPHAGAWHFVVLSMGIMFALPALESLLLGRGAAMELGPIRGWFLWLAIALVSLNYLPTRHWPSAMLFAGGQALLLAPDLPVLSQVDVLRESIARQLIGIALIVTALALAAFRRQRQNVNAHPLDAAWLSFRDTFGGLWALRVFERMAVAGRTYGWPLSLGWSGFYFHHPAEGWSDVNEKTLAEVRQALDNLLRRFVDVRDRG